jgi:NAD(P)-dependent dehydrogenase (short-subunit alcohol dehydrogenase family)
LAGKVAIVRGGYCGLGLETVKALLSAGCHVIVGIRLEEKAEKNLAGLNVEKIPLDLTDISSIRAFASKFLESSRPLNILINNAAVMASPLLRDSRGYEHQFSTNVLGHYSLTALLWPALISAGGARVIILSSAGHMFSPVVFEDPNFEHRDYDPMSSYGQSKTGDILLSLKFDEIGKGSGIRCFSLHPGVILETDLSRWGQRTPEDVAKTQEMWKNLGLVNESGKILYTPEQQIKTIPQGASTTVWAATSPFLDGKGGLYLENCNISPLAKDIVPVGGMIPMNAEGFAGVKDYAVDPAEAEKLWALCEKLTGVKL